MKIVLEAKGYVQASGGKINCLISKKKKRKLHENQLAQVTIRVENMRDKLIRRERERRMRDAGIRVENVRWMNL